MARAAGVKRVGKAGFLSKRDTLKRFGRVTAKKYFG
jgi:hypothetical protein